uniref:Hydrogenase nickel insertion protein HypA n=1 Tax=Raoultella ornithinolytica TaxID=54291 RepID=A0A1V0M3X1_RAOOR|nr:Hydrogenase nickel insertion protein HypA [Raoultella ornithinolytica]URQ56818.1 Hydrogenase nickel insertion protein HypA [Raoultella planticola]
MRSRSLPQCGQHPACCMISASRLQSQHHACAGITSICSVQPCATVSRQAISKQKCSALSSTSASAPTSSQTSVTRAMPCCSACSRIMSAAPRALLSLPLPPLS